MMVVFITLALSAVLCGLYLLLARRWQILDTPNGRSSHQQPTPHGGGVPLLLAFVLGLLLAPLWHGPWGYEYIALASAAVLLMSLGIVDDMRGLSVRLRMALYGTCCVILAAILLQSLMSQGVLMGSLLAILAALAMLWSLNLYNFMDGIDGFAAASGKRIPTDV